VTVDDRRTSTPIISHRIAGKETPSQGDRHADVRDPATGATIAVVEMADANAVDAAVAVAAEAFRA
jgi:acyl-CoA reductase-like NAD-dependent aldehyde dehydrogenase